MAFNSNKREVLYFAMSNQAGLAHVSALEGVVEHRGLGSQVHCSLEVASQMDKEGN